MLDGHVLQTAGLQHLQDLLGLVPNLTWAGGTSRPRYFQLRGVGELEQYQGAPNPSIGFLIDDIDFSGVGMPATLFDVEQIEVLRGPQGTALRCQRAGGPDQAADARRRRPSLELDTEVTVGEDGMLARRRGGRRRTAWRGHGWRAWRFGRSSPRATASAATPTSAATTPTARRSSRCAAALRSSPWRAGRST